MTSTKKKCDITGFTVIPAIDLKSGRCVRLSQGKADQETEYSDDPVGMARYWQEQGARALHIVDLDGAFEGRPVHAELVGKIAAAVDIPVELGGGLRTDADLRNILDRGVARVIVGTRAWSEPAALERLVDKYREQLAVGIDALAGQVQVKGWTETTKDSAVTLARRMDGMGVRCIIYTDTARDGMLGGVDAKVVDPICAAVDCCVISAGGVSSVSDVRALKDLKRKNLVGAIVGKALYEGRVTLRKLQEA